MSHGAPDWQRVIVGPGGSVVGGFASLTGPGETATPGDLTQAGGFDVQVPAGDAIGFNVTVLANVVSQILQAGGGALQVIESAGAGIEIESTSGILLLFTNTGGQTIMRSATQVYLEQTGGVSIGLGANLMEIAHLPTAPPAGHGFVWDNAGVLNITP